MHDIFIKRDDKRRMIKYSDFAYVRGFGLIRLLKYINENEHSMLWFVEYGFPYWVYEYSQLFAITWTDDMIQYLNSLDDIEIFNMYALRENEITDIHEVSEQVHKSDIDYLVKKYYAYKAEYSGSLEDSLVDIFVNIYKHANIFKIFRHRMKSFIDASSCITGNPIFLKFLHAAELTLTDYFTYHGEFNLNVDLLDLLEFIEKAYTMKEFSSKYGICVLYYIEYSKEKAIVACTEFINQLAEAGKLSENGEITISVDSVKAITESPSFKLLATLR